MVFSSVPVYLDPPPNWQQQPNQQGGVAANNENHQIPPLPPPPHVVEGGGNGSIRPVSMVDRARLAKIPQPEAAIKCPRCDSTNTKFCYFNNYSLSQPRHFCKTCRRYWTRGGALRNVPVGGGCRRNKKSKSQNCSKSPVSNGSERQMGSNSCSSTSSAALVPSDIIGHLPPQPNQHLPFITSLHNLTTQFGVGNIGLNFGGIHGYIGATSGASGGQTDNMGFQLGSNDNSGMMSSANAILSSGGGVQQFPFFEPPPAAAEGGGLYPFQNEGVDASSCSMVGNSQLRSMSSSSRVSQLAPVKMEHNNQQELNLSKPFLGISDQNQYWSGNTWTDLSGLNSSSASHLL